MTGRVFDAGPPGPLSQNHPLLQPRQLVSEADAGAAAIAVLLRPPVLGQLTGGLAFSIGSAAHILATTGLRTSLSDYSLTGLCMYVRLSKGGLRK